jgi:hypothetical protein
MMTESEMNHKKSLVMFDTRFSDTIKVTILSFCLVIISLLLQCNIGMNLGDEGYLWYGAVQTLSGEVPVRDFQSYDPGRYYWAGFWMLLFGKGIISLRLSLSIFQAIGLSFGLLALRRVIRSWSILVVAGAILLMWMVPRHKLFESSLSMMGVYFAVRLIENPSFRQHFISGIFVGAAAFFGRNHGLYNFVAFVGLILFIRLRLEKTKLFSCGSIWLCGVLLGYSPMLIMIITVPGFFDAFLLPFMRILSRGATNIPKPIPWPWRHNYLQMPFLNALALFCTSSFFLLLPLFHIFAILSSAVSKRKYLKRKSLLLASGLVGVMYMHHTFSRADWQHLGQGIAPLVIGMLTVPFAFNFDRKKLVYAIWLTLLLAMTFLAAGTKSEYYKKLTARPGTFVKSDVGSDELWMYSGMAQQLKVVRRINSELVPANEGFLIAPSWPAMYPLLQRKSPLHTIYFLHKEPETKQKKMIEQLQQEKVNWVLLGGFGRNKQRSSFSKKHKLLWKYFKEHYDFFMVKGLAGNQRLLRRKMEQ